MDGLDTLTIIQPSASLLDPHVWTDRAEALNIRAAVFEPLVRSGSAVTPILAERWESSDARTWTLTLRPGVRFHDGIPLRSRDVVAALDRARCPCVAGELGTSSLYHAYLGGARIEAIGDDRVAIALPEPFADLLDVLADIPITREPAGASSPLTGTGPYRITDNQPGRVAMTAIQDHWAGAPSWSSLVWCEEPDEQCRLAALSAGHADIITPLSVRRLRDMGPDGAVVRAVPTTACVVLVCNAAAGACRDARVRQALNYGLDVPTIIAAAKQGAAHRLNGPLTDLHVGHSPIVPPYIYDAHRARSLLAAAGHADGLQLTLDFPTTMPDESQVLSEIIVDQYRRVGIEAKIRMFGDRGAYAELVKAKRIDDLACFDSTPASTYRVLREKFHAGVSGPWWQGYRNPAVDAAIDQGAATMEVDRRRAFYRDAFRHIRDDAAWVFLYSPLAVIGVSRRAERVPIAPQGMLQFGSMPVF